MYKFRRERINDSNGMVGWNVAQMLNIVDSQEHQSLYLGKVKTMFGEPDRTSNSMEDLFEYDIVAEDDKGNVIPLEVYFGPSGPAIASFENEEAEKAVIELAKQIMAAEPTDYEISCVYEDVGVTVILGVKDGKPYYESLLPGMTMDMSDEEKMAIAEQFFGKNQ